MTDSNADNTGTQTTDTGNTQQTDAANAAAMAVAQATSTQQTDANKTTENKENTNLVPEKYEFKMPDGVELDSTLAEEFSTVAKELKLGQEHAQKVAEIGGKLAQRIAEKQAEVVAQAKQEWQNETRQDKEFGGEKLAANLAVANKTFSTFGTPKLRELLDQSGLGDHPEVIRWAYRVGQAISEDKFVAGDSAQKVERDAASVMFPTMKSA